MLNTPGHMSAKPLGKGRGQHRRQRWLAQKSANVFCQAVLPTFFPGMLALCLGPEHQNR